MTREGLGAADRGARLPGVAVCFLLSGIAALLYQTAWLRAFSIVFGTGAPAVAAVLAAYMAGLAGGAAVAARYADRIRRPLRAYGVLEATIAGTALLVPWLTALSGMLLEAIAGGRADPPDAFGLGQSAFFLLTAFAVLAVPTACMGATLPLLVRHGVSNDAELGPRTGLLYGINTLGAVIGAVAGGFWLLPGLGLRGTVWIGATINLLVFVVAVFALAGTAPSKADLARSDPSQGHRRRSWLRESFATSPGSPTAGLRSSAPGSRAILPLMLASGANAFLLEVLLTRLLAHVLGGTIQAFSLMLATFLSGIALGGWGAGAVATDARRAGRAFVLTQVLIAGAIMLVYTSLGALVPDSAAPSRLIVYTAGVMLPVTLFIGATYPLAVRVRATGGQDAATAAARVYEWNTIGAIVGALGAGFVVVPMLGFEGAARIAVWTALGLAVAAAWTLDAGRARLGWATAALLASLAFRPNPPSALLERSALDGIPVVGEEVFFEVGRHATVRVVAVDGRLAVQTDGLPEATVLPRGAPRLNQTHQWLSALALAARPDARSMLMVGLGGGVALEALPASIGAVDVIELESAVVAANRHIGPRRSSDPLEDSRVRVIVNDARSALTLTDKRYDLIVSQPSHPWTAGASHLYTREFLALASAHLNDGGALLQWMSLRFVDAELVRDLAATMQDVFANVRLYQNGTALYFLGSDSAIDVERSLADSGRPLRTNVLYYSYLGLNGVDDFVAALTLDEPGVAQFAAGGHVSTDDRNRLATDSASRAEGLDAAGFHDLVREHDPLLDPGSWIFRELGASLDFPYVATRLIANGQHARAAALGRILPSAAEREIVRSIEQSLTGARAAATASLERALEIDADLASARFALLQPNLTALAAGRASADLRALASGLPPSATAVIEGLSAVRRNDYEALSRLDRALAGASPRDLWFPEATRLRSDWRVQTRNEQALNDAIRLVDRALVLRPGLDLLLLRLAAADRLGDADAFVETAREAVPVIREDLARAAAEPFRIRAADVDLTIRRLAALRQGLGEARAGYGGFGLDAVLGDVADLLAEAELLRLQTAR